MYSIVKKRYIFSSYQKDKFLNYKHIYLSIMYGFNTNTKNKNNYTLLHFYDNINNYLYPYYYEQYLKYFEFSVYKVFFKFIKLLLRYGANPNIQNKYGQTPLYNTIFSNKYHFSKLLLQWGANPNVRTNYKWTPLHCACLKKNYQSVKLLLKYNANMFLRNNKNKSCYELGMNTDNDDIINIFKHFLHLYVINNCY